MKICGWAESGLKTSEIVSLMTAVGDELSDPDWLKVKIGAQAFKDIRMVNTKPLNTTRKGNSRIPEQA